MKCARLAIVLLPLLLGCASQKGIEVHSNTQPLRIEGSVGEKECSTRIELGGHVYTFSSSLGCYVVRTQVMVPEYHVEGAGRPQ